MLMQASDNQQQQFVTPPSSPRAQPPKVQQQQQTQVTIRPQQQQQIIDKDLPLPVSIESQSISVLNEPQTFASSKQVVFLSKTDLVLSAFQDRKLQLPGKLHITSRTVAFSFTNKKMIQQKYFQMPLGYICKVQPVYQDKIIYLQLSVKYGFSIKIKYDNAQQCAKTSHLLAQVLSDPLKMSKDYSNNISAQLQCKQHLYPFTQTNDIPEYDNTDWKKLPLYPSRFFVPVPYLSKVDSQQRLVVLSFQYAKRTTVWRSGPGKSDKLQEQWLSKARIMNSRFHTIQIKNRGIGNSRSQAAKIIQLQSPAFIKESLNGLMKKTYQNHQSGKWLGHLNHTHWLEQISVLLAQACLLANRLQEQSLQSVTVLADSDVRAGQLVALTQVMLFPQYRTVDGFGELIQRQFLSWGCGKINKKEQQVQKGAAVIQFLDAVFQLTCIYPLSFEFSQELLVFIAQNVYSSFYGNFLLATRSISQKNRKIIYQCSCIWQQIKKHWRQGEVSWVNPFFVNCKQCDLYQLKHTSSAKNLRLWAGFFMKKFRPTNPDYHVYLRYQKISIDHYLNKRETQQLRKQLGEQHKELMEKKSTLRELKALQ